MAVAIGAVAIAVGAALGGGAANAAPSPTPKPTAKPTAKPSKKPTPRPTAKPTVRKPFRVGWTNQNQGASPFPGMTDGFQAAVQYINKNGGINGRKIEIVNPCYTDGTPQLAQQCGNQFANDSSLNMVMQGLSNVAGPLIDALKPSGLPILIVNETSPADFAATNAVSYTGGTATPGTSIAAVAKKEGAKSVTLMTSDSAGARLIQDDAQRLLPSSIALTKVFVTLPYTDALPLILQSKAATVDLLYNGLSTNCLPFLKAQKQLGIPSSKTMTSSSCASAQLIAQDPSLFQGAKVQIASEDALQGKGASPDLDLFIDNYPKYAAMSQAGGAPAYANLAWAAVMSLRNALKGKPDSVLDNRASLFQALHAFKGPSVMGPDTLNCGGYPQWGPSACTEEGVIVQVQGTKYVRYRV